MANLSVQGGVDQCFGDGIGWLHSPLESSEVRWDAPTDEMLSIQLSTSVPNSTEKHDHPTRLSRLQRPDWQVTETGPKYANSSNHMPPFVQRSYS